MWIFLWLSHLPICVSLLIFTCSFFYFYFPSLHVTSHSIPRPSLLTWEERGMRFMNFLNCYLSMVLEKFPGKIWASHSATCGINSCFLVYFMIDLLVGWLILQNFSVENEVLVEVENPERVYNFLAIISDHNQPGTALNAMICLRWLVPFKSHEFAVRLCFLGGCTRIFK